MKKLFNMMAIISIVILIPAACSNEEMETANEFKEIESLFTFVHNGIVFTSEYIEDEDGIVLLDEDVNSKFEELSNIPGIATIFNYDGSIEFVDNEEEAYKRMEEGTLFKEELKTRAIFNYEVVSSRIDIYCTKDLRGDTMGWNNEVTVNSLNTLPPLPKIDLNNRMSSYKFSASFRYTGTTISYKCRAVVTFYKERNCTGSSFWSAVDIDRPVDNAVRIPKSFNDKVCSLKVIWTY